MNIRHFSFAVCMNHNKSTHITTKNLRIHRSDRSAIKLLAANAQFVSIISTIGNLVMTNVALFIVKRRHLE